ncbi:unnamed protein product [Porites lobata]|uniref:Uncharacterized protein n=1 Tax=Porites lobata TaxID=104759 RepID=A0ABN8Q2S0_9CNID|nr:unnamed protein product [Porites lobata]
MSKRTKKPQIHRFFGPSETSEDNESFDQSSNSSSSLNESSSSAKRIRCSSDAETEKVTQTGTGSEDLPVTVARQNETTLSSSKQASQTDKDGDDPACHGSVHDVDVGALFRQKTAFKSLNQAEKLNIINNHFRPGDNYAFPKVFMNGCNRSFQRSW